MPQPTPTSEPARPQPFLAQSAMHSRYGGLLKVLFELAFGPIHYPDEAAAKVRELAQRGVVVYVTQARSTPLALYFNYALSRLGLPLAAFVGGINLLLWQPIGRVWRLLRQRRSPKRGPFHERFTDRPATEAEAVLGQITLQGQAAFLFLDPRRPDAATDRPKNDYVRALLTAQRLLRRPVYLVPHVLISREQSGSQRKGLAVRLTDRLLGDRRNPRALRQLVLFLSGRRHAGVRVGEAVDLSAVLRDNPQQSDEQLARMVRHDLRNRLAEEERVVAGPVLASPEAATRHILRSPKLRGEIERLVAGGRAEPEVVAEATRYLEEIAASYNVLTVRFLGALMDWLFNRIYDGVYVDEEGLARTLEAARRGPLILCPSHKSHIDYLVLSTVLWGHGVTPPHIAAGANLSFWPLGPLFRGAGAFFLRRTFRDNPLYKAVFSAYVAELLGRGTSIEFFLEGTRSRTGKLLAPRFGLLNMVIDGWRQGSRDDVMFAPVSIDYERIIEASSYEEELRGGEKRAENVRGLLSTTKVLRSRYGRVHVQFGEPLSLKDMAKVAALPQSDAAEHDDGWRREGVRIAYRLLDRVSRACSVTPTAVAAAALLAHRGRGLSEKTLVERAAFLVDFLDTEGARLTGGLLDRDERGDVVLRAAEELARDGLVSVDHVGGTEGEAFFRVPEARRIQLDYYKNTLMNHFAPAAIVGRSLAALGGKTAPYTDLYEACGFLSRLLKSEFVYRVDTTFDSHFDDTLSTLVVRGLVDVDEDGTVRTVDAAAMNTLAALLDGFVETYWVMVTSLDELRAFPLWEKELLTRALERARRAYLEGTLRSPEAQNRTTLTSALGWLAEEGFAVFEEGKKTRTVRLGEGPAPGALDELRTRLTRLLG